MGVVRGQLQAPVALTLEGKRPQYPMVRTVGGFRSRSVRCGVQKNLLFLPEIEPRQVCSCIVVTKS
jgi:hypothetical protein